MTVSPTSKRLDQGRAKYAYKCVETVCNLKNSTVAEAYKTYSKRLLTLIKNNSLGNALAFVLSKARDDKEKKTYAYHLLYDQIEQWIKEDEKKIVDLSKSKLIEEIISVNSDVYRIITVEVLSLLRWITRFAEGMIEGEENDK